MKRVLCLVLCLILAVPFAMAETADSLPKRFARQLTGGNGIRGYVSISASGLADWLSALLPFTATDIQIRAIGEKQGEMSESIFDDDDWQIKLYAENAAEKEVGTTWIYGNPEGIYFQSDLLPDTVLMYPMEQLHLLYEIFKGEWADLFFAFDPMEMKQTGANGNIPAYENVADLLEIENEEWEAEWMPVLEKYFLDLDLWLAGYGHPSTVSGEEAGSLKMTATYTIPADDLKAKAKHLIGQMLYDNDLQNLLMPLMSIEERTLYLNPTIVYFYEACIDALELKGDVIFSREMSAMGEVVNTTVSLPVPALPETLTAPAGEIAAALFDMENKNIFKGIDRIVLKESGFEKAITLSGVDRTITVNASETKDDESVSTWNGRIKMIPNAGCDENALSASFKFSANHKVWQDEKYLDHDTSEIAISFTPDFENLDEDDPFRNSYIDFQPIDLNFSIDYRNNPYQANSAVQININLDAQLPDAQVEAEMILRITTQMALETFDTSEAEDILSLSDDRMNEIGTKLIENAVLTMANLSADTLEENPAKELEENEEPGEAEPVAEATMVPPAAPPAKE